MFKAAEHRVRTTPWSSPERFSVPFFFNPDYNALIEPVLLLQDDSLGLVNNSSCNNTISTCSNNDSVNDVVGVCEQVHESDQVQMQERCRSVLNSEYKQYKHYKPIRWGDFRWLRFLGDHSDRCREVQIEDYFRGL